MAQTRRRMLNFINANDRIEDLLSVSLIKAPSSEDSYVTIRSCSDDSLTSDNQEIRHSPHYIKQSKFNRINDHITSLKRRIRKQQLRYSQNEIRNFLSVSSTYLPSISNSRSMIATAPVQRTKKSTHAIPLPPLINNARIIRVHARGIRLNTREY